MAREFNSSHEYQRFDFDLDKRRRIIVNLVVMTIMLHSNFYFHRSDNNGFRQIKETYRNAMDEQKRSSDSIQCTLIVEKTWCISLDKQKIEKRNTHFGFCSLLLFFVSLAVSGIACRPLLGTESYPESSWIDWVEYILWKWSQIMRNIWSRIEFPLFKRRETKSMIVGKEWRQVCKGEIDEFWFNGIKVRQSIENVLIKCVFIQLLFCICSRLETIFKVS